MGFSNVGDLPLLGLRPEVGLHIGIKSPPFTHLRAMLVIYLRTLLLLR